MESASQSERRKVRILLIDGEHSIRSGVVSPLETLRELMQRVAHDQSSKNNEDSASERTAESNSVHIDEVLPCNYFDLIVGSGDGGWVAAMLGRLGMSASQALQAYTRIHSALHHSGNPLEPEERTSQFNLMLKDLIGTHSTSSNPEEPFQARQSKSNTHCRTILLTMASKNLAWPILIRTYRSRKHRFEDCSIRAAILAATAVPPLFEPCNINGQSYIAASQSGHCNPVETALSEAQAIFADGTVSCIISLGSGHPGHISLPSADFTSLAATAFKLSNDAEQKSQEVQSRLNVGEKIYFRFNVEQGMQEYQQADEQGYDSASAHTRAYCRTPDVDTALDAAVRSLLGKQAIASDIQPPNAVGPSSEVQQLFTLHINSKDPIQTYINELYKFNHGLPLWDPQRRCQP
ncbi:hypothetical protein DL96DRAFT_1491485 [Flagelloscypha sp. PMI_526]|nr:hypothetical protein DL96DRAFT_1491485 [Flagelloscypha sp. PMI_526]